MRFNEVINYGGDGVDAAEALVIGVVRTRFVTPHWEFRRGVVAASRARRAGREEGSQDLLRRRERFQYKATTEVREIRMLDKLRAVEQLAKLCGWNEPEKLEHELTELLKRLRGGSPG
jgi:hypothetical protein